MLAFKWTHSGFAEEANDALHLCSSKNFVFWDYNKTQDSCNLLALVVAHSTQPPVWEPEEILTCLEDIITEFV